MFLLFHVSIVHVPLYPVVPVAWDMSCVQVLLREGDVVFKHSEVGHCGAPHMGSDIRSMLYYRVRHTDWKRLQQSGQLVDDMWCDLEGVQHLMEAQALAGGGRHPPAPGDCAHVGQVARETRSRPKPPGLSRSTAGSSNEEWSQKGSGVDRSVSSSAIANNYDTNKSVGSPCEYDFYDCDCCDGNDIVSMSTVDETDLRYHSCI